MRVLSHVQLVTTELDWLQAHDEADNLDTLALCIDTYQSYSKGLSTLVAEGHESTAKRLSQHADAMRLMSDTVRLQAGRLSLDVEDVSVDSIIKEADETASEIEDKAVLDAAIVANAQAVEHYEMCRYGTLIAWAEELGHDEIVRFLTTNLNEEKAANTKLNTLALRKGVNAKASTAA